MRRFIAIAVVAAAAAVWVGGCNGDGGGTPGPSGGATKDQSDIPLLFRFEKVKSVSLVGGGELNLASLEGHVVLLDLFGTESSECRRYAPILVSMYYRFHGQGLDVLGLAYEQAAGPEQAASAAEAYRQEFAVPYDLAIGPDAAWEELRRNAGTQLDVPALVLMDRQGVVREVFEGLPAGREAVLADRIERLLAEPTVARPAPQP